MHPARGPSRRRAAPLAGAALALLAAAVAVAAADDPAWSELAALRRALEARSPMAAAFEQEYRPAGFVSGDRERGRLSIDLPGCVRWDYEEPFAKSYLICGATVWAWNPGESAGRRAFVAAEEAPGLDLLRLDLPELEARYRATLATAAEGGGAAGERIVVRLEPLAAAAPGAAPGNGAIVEATLEIDRADRRLTTLSWSDAEGNRTRFELSGHQPLAGGRPFEPPDGVEWIDP